MSKDLLRSILASVGSLIAVFFGVSEQVISVVIDNVLLVFGAILAIVGVVQSYINPSDDDEPRTSKSK